MNSSVIRNFLSNYWVLLLFVAAKLILQFLIIHPAYELHRDEFLHLNQGNHLALGYISVPPFTSWISKLILLLGGDVFWVRFFPALFGALTVVFVWLIVEQLRGGLFSKILVSSALVFSVLMRIDILFQPNSFDILAWTMVFYFIIKYVDTENWKWMVFLAIFAALGFYNKYSIVFLFLGLFIGLLTLQIKVLKNPLFWKCLGLALILVLPNLIWQYLNHFPVMYHLKALNDTQLVNITSFGFLKSQGIIFLGALPLIIAALIAFFSYKPFRAFRFVGVTFISVLLLLAWFRAKEYYALGLYPTLFVFGAVYLEKWLSAGWKLYVRPVFIVINLVLFMGVAQFVLPILSPTSIVLHRESFERIGLLRWEDGKNHDLPQDFSDMLGWKEMADKTLQAYHQIPSEDRHNTLIFSDNYGQCGAVNYYNRMKMPEAYSFNTDYIYWLPRFDTIQNVILIGKKPHQEIIDLFTDFKRVGVVESEFSREKNTGIFLLTGSKDNLAIWFYQMAQKRKDEFDIF